MDIAGKIKAAAHRLVVVDVPDLGCRLVYQVRRVSGTHLLSAGTLHLPGLAEVIKAQQGVTEGWDLQARLNDCSIESERVAVLAADRERTAEIERTARAELMADPGALSALASTADAWLVASVEAAGVALPGVALGVLPRGVAPADVCVPDTQPDGTVRYLQPLRFVKGPAGAGQVSLDDLSDTDRTLLSTLVFQAFSAEVTAAATTFRGESGSAAADRPVGETVPATATPDSPVGAG